MSSRRLFLHTLCFVSILWVILALDATNSTKAPQMLDVFQNHILKRRIRSVIFPLKGMVLLTPTFLKAIIGGIPRGLVYTNEFDMYHPLPDTVEGWQPTLLLNKIGKVKQPQQATQHVTNVAVASSHPEDIDEGTTQNEYYFEPFDGNEYEYYQPGPYHDYDIDHNSWNFGDSIDNLEQDSYIQEGDEMNGPMSPYIHPIARNFHLRPYAIEQKLKSNAYAADYQERFATTRWYKNQNYRERRQIFDQLEAAGKMLNINLKACIKRAMCEMTMYLKPYGESLMDDVVRIILTIPHGNYDYSQRYEGVHCAHRFAVSCPHRVMDIITQNIRT